jgi:primosomal protein N' (replication factor Y)
VTRFGTDQVVPPGKMKMLFEVVQPYPVLPPDLMELYNWARQYYAATPEAILEAMIPSAIRKGMKPKTRRYIAKGKAPTTEELEVLQRRAPKQAELLKFIRQQVKPLPRADIVKAMKISASAFDALVLKGLLRETDTEELRVAYEDELGAKETLVAEARPTLTDEQDAAVNAIFKAIAQETFSVRLLHGVTGSGKTEVYLNAIEKIVAGGWRCRFSCARGGPCASDRWASARASRGTWRAHRRLA